MPFLFRIQSLFIAALILCPPLLCGCGSNSAEVPQIAEEIEAGSAMRPAAVQADKTNLPPKKDFGEVFSNWDDWELMGATEEALLAMTTEEKKKVEKSWSSLQLYG